MAGAGSGPEGHRDARLHRGDAPGILGIPPPSPGTGIHPLPNPADPRQGVRFEEFRGGTHNDGSRGTHNPTPKMDFPKFDGENPKLWKTQCENYFEVFHVQPCLRTRFASLNFVQEAALWLQNHEAKVGRVENWDEMCSLVLNQFGRNKYSLYRRQLRTLRQTGTVTEYYTKFQHIRHNLLLYNSALDDFFFVDEFLDGLRDDLRTAIWLHQPSDLDTAFRLALLQEEELEPGKRRHSHRTDHKDFSKSSTRYTTDKSKQSLRSDEDKRADTSTSDDRLESLKAYRRSKGLCFTCGEKYSKQHKCPASVPLHIVEELLEVLQIESDNDQSDHSSNDSDDEDLMLLSGSSSGKCKRKRCFRIQGFVGKRQVLILVDSGSVSSFISTKMVAELQCPVQQIPATTYVVANGNSVECSEMVKALEWGAQGHTFQHDCKVFPLGSYDMILGDDWLSDHSPMWVHWKRRIIRFTHQGRRVTLKGVHDTLAACRPITTTKLQGLLRRGGISHLIEVSPVAPTHKSHMSASEVTEVNESSETIPDAVRELLQEFAGAFQATVGLPPRRDADHRIPLIPGAQPVKSRPYRYTPDQKNEIERQVYEMLANGIIQRSHSPFASPVLLVRKKDGTWRFCIDYRQLNELTVKHKYPMPIVDELLDELAGAGWFTKLDLRSGYHQIRMAEGEQQKTAFQTHQGLYEFTVMPFGLTNAPATFQSLMNDVFAEQLRKSVLVFVDDILIYSRTLAEHLSHLRTVFNLLIQNKLLVKRSKCSFARQELEYLGHIIGSAGVSTDPSKLTAIQNWPMPKTVKALRGFLGLTGYYRKFVKHYGILAQPLTHLLKKGTLFLWGPQHQQAFEILKQAMISTPVLALPDFATPFVLETDACNTGIGAVLMQHDHPVAFMSKALSVRNQTLSAYEKECVAILMAVEKWRSYLQHQPFIIRTDHKSLLHLVDQRLHTPLQHKAFVKLMGLQYTIQYKKGSTNLAADALSRQFDSATFMAVSVATPAWLDNLQNGYKDDPTCQQLLTELSINPSNDKGYSLLNGILRYKGRIWVGVNPIAQNHILQALHSSGVGGHSGQLATYKRIKQLFAWPNLKKDVSLFVQSCEICQQAKAEHVRLPGLLQPLPVPDQAWDVVTLDFIEGLPKSTGYTVILVVVDKLTRYAHFIPLAHPFTALQVAQAYMNNIFKLHGLPKVIISDRDKIFTSTVWTELFRLSDTALHMSSAYHPQTDGTTERINQCLEGFLRCSVHSCPQKWALWLPLAEYWYNTAYHSALGKSPFEVLYGHSPRQLGISSSDCASPDLEAWLKERATMTELLKQQLVRAQQRMKVQADKKRSERRFEEGDMVYLKLQPYIQSSVATRSNHKLSFKFFGPYKVLKRIGAVAYKLDLPPASRVHPVIHVSQLKQHVPPATQVSADLTSLDSFDIPLQILDRVWRRRGGATQRMIKVRWRDSTSLLDTWEMEDHLRQRFPRAPAWGQAIR